METKGEVGEIEDAPLDFNEAMRVSLIEALLRDCDGRLRVCGKTKLTATEQEWVQDVVSLVALSARLATAPRRAARRKRQYGRLGSAIERTLTRVGLTRAASAAVDAEFQYVPVTCGLKGDYFDVVDDEQSGGEEDRVREDDDGG